MTGVRGTPASSVEEGSAPGRSTASRSPTRQPPITGRRVGRPPITSSHGVSGDTHGRGGHQHIIPPHHIHVYVFPDKVKVKPKPKHNHPKALHPVKAKRSINCPSRGVFGSLNVFFFTVIVYIQYDSSYLLFNVIIGFDGDISQPINS
jgi:hypothetical protein